MLNNPSYMGEEHRLRRTRARRNPPRLRACEAARRRAARHRLARVVGGVPAGHPREGREHQRPGVRPALLRSRIFCAECGAHMVRNYFKRGKYEYLKYRCGSRWRPYKTDCRGEAVPLVAVEEWAWGKVETLLSDGAFVERALEGMASRSHDPHLALDLQAAKRAHERCGIVLQALTVNSALGPYVERAAAQAARERQQLEKVIAELEGKISAAGRQTEDLRSLTALASAELTLEDRRLALRALGVRVYANGTDPALLAL